MEKGRTRMTEESRKGRQYPQTGGKERTEDKEKETRTSFATIVASQDIRATNVGGTRKDRCTT
eukprot:2574436-Amphidinium_carterae.1